MLTVGVVIISVGGDQGPEPDRAGGADIEGNESPATGGAVPPPSTSVVPPPVVAPSGTFGQTRGTNRVIAPGLTATGFVIDNDDGPGPDNQTGQRTGRIDVAGPGDIVVSGTYRFTDDNNWQILVDSGSGSVGGVPLPADGFSGQIATVGGQVSAAVDVALPAHPEVVPAWDQLALLRLTYQLGSPTSLDRVGLVGDVAVLAGLGSNRLGMTGPVLPGSAGTTTYRLNATGTITFAGVAVELAGTYSSAGVEGATSAQWNIDGDGDPGAITAAGVTDTAAIENLNVAMTQTRPGVTGTASVVVGEIVVATSLRFVDSGDWTLTATGSSTPSWQPPMLPGLTVRTEVIVGRVTSVAGNVEWNLLSPMTLVDEDFAMTGALAFTGPGTWRLLITGGAGSLLGAGPQATYGPVSGVVSFDSGVVIGSVRITARGQQLVAMPAGWDTLTNMTLSYGGPGSANAVDRTVVHSLLNGTSRITLAGSVQSSASFGLVVGGVLSVAGTQVPFGGTYQSAGFVVDGIARTEPYWDMVGNIADAPGGRAPIGGGAAMVGGSIGLSSDGLAAPAVTLQVLNTLPGWLRPAAATVSFTGSVTLSLADNTSFTIDASVTASDEDNWEVTLTPGDGEPWEPAGMTGLVIDLGSFFGTITSDDGELGWAVGLTEIVWDMTSGVTLTTGFSLSDTCPLEANCPAAPDQNSDADDQLFVGFTGGGLTFPDPVPDMTLDGAFLADGSWARFDAGVGDVTFHDIGITDAGFSAWKGERSDTFDPNLVMSDLSANNNGFSLEFCGNFRVTIPDITTVNTGGCVQWSPDGIVMAQVGTDGDLTAGESNGVTIGGINLNGFAWTDLATLPEVTLNGIDLLLMQGRNELTANIEIPGTLMEATGNGDTDAVIAATGWFSSGDFFLSGDIEVNMRAGGFTLDSVGVTIGKDGDSFSLGLGADATVSISGNHFPVSAYVGVEAGGGSSEIVVRLDVQGSVSADPNGKFDLPTLLPTGDFEPDYTSVVNGDFDASAQQSLIVNGDFENGVRSQNLFPNGNFEDGVGANLLTDGGFEDGAFGDVLVNGDAEDTDVLINGDFETGTTQGWYLSSFFTATVLAETSAPTDDEGTTAVTVRNTKSSGTQKKVGLFQRLEWAPVEAATYELSAWIRSPDSDTSRLAMYVEQKGTAAGCTTQATATTTDTFSVGSTWTQVTLPVIGVGCRSEFNIILDPLDGGASMTIDAVTFGVTTSPVAIDIPNTGRPDRFTPTNTATFDTLPPISKASDVNLATDFGNPGGSLRSDGNGSWWLFNTDSYGYADGDFEISYDVYFAASSSRDMLDMGFWNSGSGTSATGYLFRVQSADSDSGFHTVKNGSKSRVSGDASFSPLPREVWHRVRLTAVGASVTASIVQLDTGALVHSTTLAMPSGNRAGVFGQLSTNNGTDAGNRLDNFTVYSAPGVNQNVRLDPASAHTGSSYLAATSDTANWGLQTSTSEQPEQGTTWSFSAWVRSRGANVSGKVYLATEGGTLDTVSMPFTATGQWTKVSATLLMNHDDHTNLLAGFTQLSPAGVELNFDDVQLQEIPWTVSPSTPGAAVAVVTSDGESAFEGLGALEFTDRANGSSLSTEVGPPEQGATYTASVWTRSGTAVGGTLRLVATGARNETSTTSFTASGGWTRQTTSLAIANAGHDSLRLFVDVAPGNQGRTLVIDDASVTATNVQLPQQPEVAWGPGATATFDTLPPISKASDVNLATDFGNPGGSLRSDGNGSWWLFNTDSYGYADGDFEISYDVYFAASSSRDMLDMGFWNSGSGTSATGYLFRVQSADSDSGFHTVKNGSKSRVSGDAKLNPLPREVWHRVRLTAVGSTVTATVTRLDNNTVVHGTSIAMPSGNRAGVFGQLSTNNGTNAGHRVDNFAVYKGSAAGITPVVRSGLLNQARSGAGYIQLTAPSAGTAMMSRTSSVSPAVGSGYVARAWVKAPAGNVAGIMTLSSGLESVSVPFTAKGSWQELTTTLNITQSGATGLTMTFDHNTAALTLQVDDVSAELVGLTQPEPWEAIPGSGGTLPTALWADESIARSGAGYLEVQANNAAGSVVKDVDEVPAPGSNYTASVWVRAPASVRGQLMLTAQGGTSQTRSVDFTATTQWQQVFVTLPVTEANHTSLRTEVRITTLGRVLNIDDAELRIVPDWAPSQPSGVTVNELVVTDGARAASGPGFLRFASSGANGGVVSSVSTTVRPGAVFTMRAYVRSTAGADIAGRMRMTATGTATESKSLGFTATSSWQFIELHFTATANNTSLRPEITLAGAGSLDVDQISITPDVFVQDDPWINVVAAGGSVTATMYEDPERAHDSLGLLVLRTTGNGESGVYHDIGQAPERGTIYPASVWVRSPTGVPVAGRFTLATLGGTPEAAEIGFVADDTWQLVSLRLPIVTGGHSGLRATVLVATPGVDLDVDDVKVQQEVWTSFTDAGGNVTQNQVNDGERAESGSGYLQVGKSTGAAGGVRLVTPGNVAGGSQQTVSAHVRSTTGAPVSGRLTLTASGGGTDNTATAAFTATEDWEKVTLTLAVTSDGQTSLSTQVFVDSVNAGLDIDSVTIGQEPLTKPDGVTTALPHPERGYAYLWDDAFGVPGAHLWALTAQIQLINGQPGLGVGATVYFDPTKASAIMTGTDWLKGDMALNVSSAEPCFSIGFDATGTNTRVAIDGGVFSTSKFLLGFAPKGCEVGDYVVPPGASFAIDTELGDAEIQLELAIGRDQNNLPTFYANTAVYNLRLAGVTYNTMSLIVDVNAESSYTGFIGDFTLPIGKLYGDFELDVNADLLRMEGGVRLTDWKLAGGGFDVELLEYQMSTDIPFGAGACATSDSSIAGLMSLGSRSYDFDGQLVIDCGDLKVLSFEFDYEKDSVSYRFYIDYDSSTDILAGGLAFNFERKTSWNFFGFRYQRHPKFTVRLDFSMDVNKPSSGTLAMYGAISVSGGSGSLDCTISGDPEVDDGCSLYVRIDVFGGHTYRSSW
jgi:hypothetical protein